MLSCGFLTSLQCLELVCDCDIFLNKTHVSASSQSLRIILSLRMYSSFITSGPGHTHFVYSLLSKVMPCFSEGFAVYMGYVLPSFGQHFNIGNL